LSVIKEKGGNMSEHDLRKKAIIAWLDALISLKEKYGKDAVFKELAYFENATPRELMKDSGISEEEAKMAIEVTKSMIAFFRI
jgi:hypothetical protein